MYLIKNYPLSLLKDQVKWPCETQSHTSWYEVLHLCLGIRIQQTFAHVCVIRGEESRDTNCISPGHCILGLYELYTTGSLYAGSCKQWGPWVYTVAQRVVLIQVIFYFEGGWACFLTKLTPLLNVAYQTLIFFPFPFFQACSNMFRLYVEYSVVMVEPVRDP